MVNILRKISQWLIGLKQYHAMHAFTAVPGFFMIAIYAFVIFEDIFIKENAGESAIFLLAGFMVYTCILCICAILAICILFVTLLLKIYKKKSIFVKSTFLLKNKFYNVIFYTGLIINIITFLIFIFAMLDIDFGGEFDLGMILCLPLAIIYGIQSVISAGAHHLINIFKNIF